MHPIILRSLRSIPTSPWMIWLMWWFSSSRSNQHAWRKWPSRYRSLNKSKPRPSRSSSSSEERSRNTLTYAHSLKMNQFKILSKSTLTRKKFWISTQIAPNSRSSPMTRTWRPNKWERNKVRARKTNKWIQSWRIITNPSKSRPRWCNLSWVDLKVTTIKWSRSSATCRSMN